MSKIISNVENYKKDLNESVNTIIHKYIECLNEYIIFAISNVHIQKNYYFKYIIIKGLETIYYVFFMLLMYTKNLDLVFYHTSKSFYYYIEFIGQVGDDNHVFLRLTSKDAILFVYKKTIFEINDSYQQTFVSPIDDEKIKFNTIGKALDTINSVLKYTFDKYEVKNSPERNNIYLDTSNNILKYFMKMCIINNTSNNSIQLQNNFNILQDFNEKIVGKINGYENYNNIIISFIKKLTKHNINYESYYEKAKYSNFETDNLSEINKSISQYFD